MTVDWQMVDRLVWRIAHEQALRMSVEAEELHGAAMLRLVRDLPEYAPERGRFGPWVARRALYGMVDAVRDLRRCRRKDHAGVRFTALRTAHGAALLARQEEMAMAAEAWEALDVLPERHRLMMWLYYADGWVMREIGKRLGVNESRISQMHRWALKKLQMEMGVAA